MTITLIVVVTFSVTFLFSWWSNRLGMREGRMEGIFYMQRQAVAKGYATFTFNGGEELDFRWEPTMEEVVLDWSGRDRLDSLVGDNDGT